MEKSMGPKQAEVARRFCTCSLLATASFHGS